MFYFCPFVSLCLIWVFGVEVYIFYFLAIMLYTCFSIEHNFSIISIVVVTYLCYAYIATLHPWVKLLCPSYIALAIAVTEVSAYDSI